MRRYPFFITASLVLLAASLTAEDSIVPPQERISDFDTRLALAQILSREPHKQAQALELFQRLHAEKPERLDVITSLGRLYVAMHDFTNGLNTLYSALESNPEDPEAVMATAQAEAAAGHPLKARNLFLKAVALSSDKDKASIDFADGMMSWGDFYKAEDIFRSSLDKNPDVLEHRLRLGWALVSEHRYFEAEGIYEQAFIQWPDNEKILKDWHKLMILERKEEKDPPEDPVSNNPSYIDWMAIADDHINEGELECALEAYESILDEDPDYYPAQIGKAEILSSLFRYEESLNIYLDLLEEFPENYKLTLAIARVLGWSKRYSESIAWYDTLLCMNLHDPVLYREKARTSMWAKRYHLAMRTYNELLEPPEMWLQDGFFDAEEIGARIQESICLEKRAEALQWYKRWICAIEAQEDALAVMPGNEEILFDEAQTDCVLGLCSRSQDIYHRILEFSPGHNLVRMALDRSEMKFDFNIRGNFSYWRELGSGSFSQSQIARYRVDTIFEQPFGCHAHLRFIQTEYVENPFFNFKFYAAEGQTLEGDYLFNEHACLWMGVTYKNYFGKFKHTFTAHNRLLLRPNDCLEITLGCNREDEIYNIFCLEQRIQSTVSWITLASNINRYMCLSGTYQYYRYNDHNHQDHVNLLAEYQFTEDPNLFKIILQGDYRNTAHQSVNITVDNKLVDVIHPYWTPDHYFAGTATLAYRHDYRYFEFCEAPQRYVDIKISGITDSVSNAAFQSIVEWKHDFDCSGGIELKGYIQRSKEWNAEGAWASVYYIF